MLENQITEWKESWHDDYLKWICGFANSQGGILEIGRNDAGQVVGLADTRKLLEDLPNKIRDLLGILPRLESITENHKHLIRITVEPYPYPISYRGHYFIRSGSTNQELRGPVLDQFLLSRTGKRWDSVPVPGVSVGDLDASVLAKFRERASKSKRLGAEVLDEDDTGLIEKLHLKEGEYLKRAAILLFHPDPEKLVTGASIKIGFFENNADLLYHDEIRGDLFTQVEQAMDLLLTKYFRASISYEGVQRIETYPIPESALRETLVNAVAHKDYSSGAPIQISVYEDRVLFWNSGFLPPNWTVAQLTSKHSSQPFNPDVANAFFRAGMIEAWGRGIEKVIQACLDQGTLPPMLRYEDPGLWVEFAIGGGEGTKLGLSRDQAQVLRKCRERSNIQSLMDAVGRSNRTKFRDQVLKVLIADGLVAMVLPDKPRSPKQEYELTLKGRAALAFIDRGQQN